MRVSFDLDEVLFVSPQTHKTEPPLPFPLNRFFKERLRLLPLCMPLSIVNMHFVCYGQASGKQLYVHVLSALDGAVCVVAFAALTIRI